MISAPSRAKHVRRLLALLAPRWKRRFLWLAATGMAIAIATPALACTSKRVMDAVVAATGHGALEWIAVEFALVVGQIVLLRSRETLRASLKERLELEVKLWITRVVARFELCELEHSATRDHLERARKNAESAPIDFVAETLTAAQGLLSLLVYTVILAHFSRWAVFLLLAVAPAAAAEAWDSRQLFQIEKDRSPHRRRLDYFEQLLTASASAKEVKVFDLGAFLHASFRELGERFATIDGSLRIRATVVACACQVLPMVTFYGFYGVMAMQAAEGVMTLGTLALYALSFHNAQRISQTILAAMRTAYDAHLRLEDLFAFLDRPSPEQRPIAVGGAATERAIRGALELNDVGFRYSGAASWALRNVTFRVDPGEFVAVVGSNGSGKTTLLKLITGLYRPTEGRILLDGRDLMSFPRAELYARFGVVFQDFIRYDLPLRHNISVGALEHVHDDARLLRALRRCGAGALVDSLPRGLDTELGTSGTDRSDLSGGQWQKLALARMFLRDGADVLVLDEPSSALDRGAEGYLAQQLQAFERQKTILLISHHLATIQKADKVLVLEGGTLVESQRIAASPGFVHPATAAGLPLKSRIN